MTAPGITPVEDRDSPQALDAERSVLAAMLIDHESVGRAIEMMETGDFFCLAHRKIFDAILALYNRNEKADLITLSEELRKRGDLESLGGTAALSQILEYGTTSKNLERHVELIVEKSVLRRLILATYEIQHEAFAGGDETSSILNRSIASLEVYSAALKKRGSGRMNLPFQTAAELATVAPASVPWIAPPWVASGCITEIDGKVKAAGKTTLVGALVAAVLDGRPFLGMPTKLSPVVWLTEQSPSSFREVLRRAGLLDRVDLVILSWHNARRVSWPEIVEAARAEAARIGAGLLVVDTLGQFADLPGDSENNAGAVREAVKPLQAAAAGGLGVILTAHERKSGGEVGESGRGSSALAGAVDVIIALGRPEGAQRPTIRQIRALSRFDETPPSLLIELVDDTYDALGTQADVAAQEARAQILDALPISEAGAIRLDELLKRLRGVKRTTALDVLGALVSTGHAGRVGKGVKRDPHRYYRPGTNSFCRNSVSTGPAETNSSLDRTGPERQKQDEIDSAGASGVAAESIADSNLGDSPTANGLPGEEEAEAVTIVAEVSLL